MERETSTLLFLKKCCHSVTKWFNEMNQFLRSKLETDLKINRFWFVTELTVTYFQRMKKLTIGASTVRLNQD